VVPLRKSSDPVTIKWKDESKAPRPAGVELIDLA
jgi:hypothetical protein